MFGKLSVLLSLLLHTTLVSGCDVCDHDPQTQVEGAGPTEIIIPRHVRRMQPDAVGAIVGPHQELSWGQINFLHSTDTHGWLAGHVKERNYGADWGDWLSFVTRMREKAALMDVDLLVVDTGDLHDGNGLTDSTSPNGVEAMQVWERLDYDLLTIGNHELYVAEVAYYHFANFTRVYGDRYLTSNVQIRHPETDEWQFLGNRFKYFTTPRGVRVMSFGILFDFNRAAIGSRVIRAEELVKLDWFIKAVEHDEPIDLFVILGHNPVSPHEPSSSWETILKAIRERRPEIPIQIFGGHQHIRDFAVYDNRATGLASGQYCETMGWLAMTNVNSTQERGNPADFGHDLPSQKAVPVDREKADYYKEWIEPSEQDPLYSRRYMDWNRLTMEYHAKLPKKQSGKEKEFDTKKGIAISDDLYHLRHRLNLKELYGCAPRTYCKFCVPFLEDGSIFKVVQDAMRKVVVRDDRLDTPRLIFTNTGSIRFDLPKGPFTKDDSFILSPFANDWLFVKDVPYEAAKQLLTILNSGPYQRKSLVQEYALSGDLIGRTSFQAPEACVDPPFPRDLRKRDGSVDTQRRLAGIPRLVWQQDTDPAYPNSDGPITPGKTTEDDFGTDGDDTRHSPIPNFNIPIDVMANASFPADGSEPERVDVVFVTFMTPFMLNALNQAAGWGSYSEADIKLYNETLTTNNYLAHYAKQEESWQTDMPLCPIEHVN